MLNILYVNFLMSNGTKDTSTGIDFKFLTLIPYYINVIKCINICHFSDISAESLRQFRKIGVFTNFTFSFLLQQICF